MLDSVDEVGIFFWKRWRKEQTLRTAAPVIFILNLHDRHVNWWSSEEKLKGRADTQCNLKEIFVVTCEWRWLACSNKRLRWIWEWKLRYGVWEWSQKPLRYAGTDCAGLGWMRLTSSFEGDDANIFDWNIRKNKTCCGDFILDLPNWHVNWIFEVDIIFANFFQGRDARTRALWWFHVWAYEFSFWD